MADTLAKKREKMLRPVRANLGLEVKYRRALLEEIEAMGQSVAYHLKDVYRRYNPHIAMDRIPADELRDAMARLSRMWTYRFDKLATWLADYFAKDAQDRSDTALAGALRKAGFTVRFAPSPIMRDVLKATVHENVNLIKSIPQQYLTRVEGMVMRSVQAGRDIGQLTDDLQNQLGVERRRAALIARDQNNKATSAYVRTRQTELGITKAVWVHSGAGREPRPAHVRMNGKTYDVSEGMYDSTEGRNVFPGELINCRCVSRSVLPGFA